MAGIFTPATRRQVSAMTGLTCYGAPSISMAAEQRAYREGARVLGAGAEG